MWEESPFRRQRSAARRDALRRTALQICDLGVAAIGLVIVTALSGGTIAIRPEAFSIAPCVLIAAKALGLYHRDQHVLRSTTLDEVPALVYLSVLYALGVWLGEHMLLRGGLGPANTLELLAIALVLWPVGHALARAAAVAVGGAERCLILAPEGDAAHVVGTIQRTAGPRAVVVGCAALPDGRWPRLVEVAAGSAPATPLVALIRELRADRVVVAANGHDQDEVLHTIRVISTIGVKVTVVPRLLEVVGPPSIAEELEGLTLLAVRSSAPSRSSLLLKTVMDLVLAAGALALLSPMLALIALAVKIDSRGPVLFRQRRVGCRSKAFLMLKFRSMVNGAELMKDDLRPRNQVEGGLFKITEDPRITRVGRFLRRTSLDELPQLFNVLSGSMSLVGPRPLVENEDVLIGGWGRRRLALKPGMTGAWQIFGSSRIPMRDMLTIDYLYGTNWSLWLDVKILLRTVPYVLRGHGM